MSLDKWNCKNLVGILTEHCLLREHAHRIGLVRSDMCAHCMIEGTTESVEHILCNCPALSIRRHARLEMYFLDDLKCVADISLHRLRSFTKQVKFLTTEQLLQTEQATNSLVWTSVYLLFWCAKSPFAAYDWRDLPTLTNQPISNETYRFSGMSIGSPVSRNWSRWILIFFLSAFLRFMQTIEILDPFL